LLTAGLRILVDDPAEHAFDHLKAARVAAAAGRTTGAFFHHWPSQDDYVLDLIDFAFQPDQSSTLPLIERFVAEELVAGHPIGEVLARACELALEHLPEDPQTVIEYLLWKRAVTDREFGRWLLERFHRLDGDGARTFVRLLELAHRRPRPPFTAQNIAVLLPALVQSVALRQLVDQDDLPDGAIRWIVLSAVPLLTAGPSDDLDAQEYTADLLHRTELDRPIG
jgi:AcrR family transcriptional regulator